MSTYAVSRVSPSIVRLTYYAGSQTRVGNGTIFSCIRDDDDDDQFVSYILSTRHLFDSTCLEREKGKGVHSKLDVCVSSHGLYEGEVMVCDLDMCIVVVKVKSDDALPVATLTPFTDCISLAPFGVPESSLSTSPTKLIPGDEVTIVCQETQNVLVKTGIHSLDRITTSLDRKAFLRINCEDINIIDGAPVINCQGDVIGVAFRVPEVCVAFLPVNIFIKWWKHVLKYGEICRPNLGMTLTSLYAASLIWLEDVVLDCDVYDGVMIDELYIMGPAGSAGLRVRDVISQCDGRPVRSLLEFFEFIWDKTGEVFEAKGVTHGCHSVWKVEIQAIKGSLVPQILAESFAANAAPRKEREKSKPKDKKKSKKDKEPTSGSANGRKNRKRAAWELIRCPGIRKKVSREKR